MRRLLLTAVIALARLTAAIGRLSGEPGDFKPANVPVPTLGGKQFWSDELFFHQWRIQRNALSGECRLLDGHDLRFASGTYDDCCAVLQQIKQQRRLPRMAGKAVVVLHGLVRSRAAMDPLSRYLREHGGYQVFNVSYPSTQEDIAEHARSLRHIIDSLDGIEEINFVGHSLGNVVIRHYLGDLARRDPRRQSRDAVAADRRARARFHRFVMLTPPNQGARLAETFADNVFFKEITGAAGQQLGRDWPELERHLATPDFEFGIIAGGKGDGKGYNPMLPGDNDGVISVATTKLAGARDFALLPVLHSFVLNNDKAHEYVLRFLKHGYFISAQRRRPLERQP